jgi:CheY-like chemotaxis protein
MGPLLVVDDEFSIVDALCEVLSWEGYACERAHTGEEGLAALGRTRPVLVLLDYMMPVMDGLQMLRAMRQDPEHRHIPVVMLTAAPRALPRDERLWDALLAKPFDLGQLLATLERLIGKPGPQGSGTAGTQAKGG